MKPCAYTLFMKNSSDHKEDVDRIIQTLNNAGFTRDDAHPNVVIVLGGDGSLMRAFSNRHHDGDFIMINYGHLGYFSDYGENEIDKFLDDILHREPIHEVLPLLTASINGFYYEFVNDLTLQSERTMEIEVYVNRLFLTRAKATGIVIGSMTASTGYLASLGCPVDLSSKDIYLYHFIAPIRNRLHTNTIESAILSERDTLDLRIKAGYGICYTDGMRVGELTSKQLEIGFRPKRKQVCLLHFSPVDNRTRIQKAFNSQGGFL